MSDEGLRIIGEASIGFPAPANTYRSVAYANTKPDGLQALLQ